MNPTPRDLQQPPGYYFFLSYAHSAPAEPAHGQDSDDEQLGADADPVVEAFYTDLVRAVRSQARPGNPRVGFLDQSIPAGSDIKTELSSTLGSAQVFVPLYSPGYVTRSWPQREQEVFRRRLALVGVNPDTRIVPVLWTPVLWPERYPDIERAMRTAGAGPEYRENGLRALFLLKSHRKSHRNAYESFRSWLAGEIVALAEGSPLKPSVAPKLEEVEGSDVKEARFLVAMLGPEEIPARSNPWWRTYAAPVAQHAASVADRLGLRCEVADVMEAERLFDQTPGIVLVDPWPATDPESASLATRLSNLPAWVLPVVLEEPREQVGEHSAAIQATIIAMRNAAQGRVESVTDMVQLDRILPELVARARRLYLKEVRIAGIPAAAKRPSLRDVAE